MEKLGWTKTLERLYRVLWTWIGGRPWTYIIRDTWADHPLRWIFGLLFAGTVLGHLFW